MKDGQLGLLVMLIICSVVGVTAWVARRKIEAWELKDEEGFKEKHKYLYAYLTYPAYYFTKKNILKKSLLINAIIYSIFSIVLAIAFVVSFLA